MNVQSFYNQYSTVAKQAQNLQFNYQTMTAPDKAEASVELQKSMNKLFADKLQSDWLGKSVDILA